ncbi:MAG TPA: EpsG family protein [Bacteroidales bacterium]|nr:EpsG family protein [Bacteroidales bacterium]HQG52504.1 EpsG family protein [Bacteroidales bacterium]HQJ20055.1 EpsG family protein [Bacteroidales bacterium]
MLIAALSSLVFANIVNHSSGFKQDVKKLFLFVVYIWLILIFSFRETSVPDTSAYLNYYNSNGESGYMEYLFTLMCKLCNFVGLNFNGFLLIYQIILFSIWFYCSKKIFNDIHLAFLVFFPFMGIYNFGITIRAGMGLCLCYVAITYLIYNKSFKGYLVYFLLVTISVFFHQAMIIFYILPLFLFIQFNSIVYLVIILISIILPLINIQHLIADIFEAYLKFFSSDKLLTYTQIHANFDISGIYSKTMIKYWLLALVFIALRSKIITKKELYNSFLNIYIAGVLLISATHFITAGNRLSYMFFFFEFAIVTLLYENSNLPKKLVLLGIIGLAILNYINLISAVPEMIAY